MRPSRAPNTQACPCRLFLVIPSTCPLRIICTASIPAMTAPAVASAVLRKTHPSQRGSSGGVLSAFYDLSVGLGSFVAGAVAKHFGYSAAFVMAACAIGVAAFAASLSSAAKTTKRSWNLWLRRRTAIVRCGCSSPRRWCDSWTSSVRALSQSNTVGATGSREEANAKRTCSARVRVVDNGGI